MLLLVFTEYFPGLNGEDLRKELFKTADSGYKSLGYNRGREELYGYIANDPKHNYVIDVYTGLIMDCPYDSMSTQCNPSGDLNCEHTVPQSFFDKKEPMKGDVYHMKTSWKDSNGARSNYAFEEFDLAEAKKYYGDKKEVTSEKPKDAENYSVLSKQNTFMPRIQQKGDSARAVAYFYVKYPEELKRSLLKTFVKVDDMIEWDMLYAPTEQQMQETSRIQEVQGNINPFMWERNLVFRAYCDLSEGKYPCQ